jgi:hypothetical protein
MFLATTPEKTQPEILKKWKGKRLLVKKVQELPAKILVNLFCFLN